MCLTLFHFNRLSMLGDSGNRLSMPVSKSHHEDAAWIRASAQTALNELTAYVCNYIKNAGAGCHDVCYAIVQYMGDDNTLWMLKQHVSSGQMTDRLNFLGKCTLVTISNTYNPWVWGVV